ncbi:pyridoxamine 5'-phosphate oxidase family protein [Methanospirillum lacunae]|uniref:Pyridoxamine 5'-phosphate oxidase family protein n=1 Tax=Methanospirillum lacunae TaxID=668570 RepID=A0A2V2N1Y0_9EURY|nr:pyridoxamine 5'-phosphate oxidase family protein [Methanospirillum lacunae]PWR70538.1 pyridoxamine 5'-phosphate oxidase family protein [Methanospirillum lacunae]
MHRTDKEVQDQGWIDAVLKKALFCHLAIPGDDEYPCLVPMNFVWYEGRLILHSSPVGDKIRLLKNNPHASFAVESDIDLVTDTNVCGYGMRYRSVIGRGTVRFVEEYKEKNRLLKVFSEKYASYPVDNFFQDKLDNVAVLVIKPISITGKNSGYPL